MKVNSSVNKGVNGVNSRAADLEKQVGNKNKGAEKASIDSSAKVNVSQKAQAFSKAKAIASDQSVDEAKVARLQKLIDDGNYSVDAEAIADRLVGEHLLIN